MNSQSGPRRTPTFLHAESVIHCSVEGNEDLIEVFTDNDWYVIDIKDAAIVHKNYHVRTEGFRWHPKETT